MHSAGGPDMLVAQFAPATPKPKAKKQLTFESSQSSPSQSPEDAEQIVPASPQQDAEASAQQGAASSSQPSAPAAKPALPQPGSTTLIGISGEDRYRITYEARVVPGQWARLSNISDSGTWLKTESFKVGDCHDSRHNAFVIRIGSTGDPSFHFLLMSEVTHTTLLSSRSS